MQDFKINAIPAPAFARQTTCGAGPAGAGHRGIRQRRQDARHWHGLQHGGGATGVVLVAMTDDHGVQITDAAGAQIRYDHAATTVGLRAVERTGIVEQSMIARLRDHAQTLTDIQYGQTQHTLR